MVAIAQKVRLLAGLSLTVSLLTATGCVQTRRQAMRQQQQGQPAVAKQAPVKLGKPTTGPCELAVRWNNEVATAPDPTRGGELSHGLVGRVYLFNHKQLPMEGDGSLHIELADAS